MSTNLQVKLLRVLQDRSFEPVGSSKTVSVDVRVIAATNQNLEEAIRERRFREDLFYRLNVIPIEAPALRHRREDIPVLVEHFLERSRRSRGRAIPGISSEALDLLCAYDWPGNVRELENLIERLVTLGGEQEITPADLPANLSRIQAPALSALRVPVTGLSFRDVVEDVEEQLIREALEITHGNKNRAAQLLGLNRTTLLEKMKRRAGARPPPPLAPPAPATDGFATGAGPGRRNSDAFAAGRGGPPPVAAAAPRKRLRNGRSHEPRQIPEESGT
jgi:transcriptional regulator with PAS, ATPase and Fis domain